MHIFHADVVAPLMVFAVPIVAIAGGILAGIVRTVSSHRLMEVAIRERMALTARGVPPDQITAALGAAGLGPGGQGPIAAVERFRAQGLMVAGFVTLAGGGAIVAVDYWIGMGDAWPVGVIALCIGGALLLSGALIWPRGRHAQA